MDLKLYLAILVGKLLTLVIRLARGGATAAPGLFALYIDPNLVKKLSKKIKNGSIIVSGTNGKTTTARLIFDIVSTQYKVVHNRQGSNLLRGIASTLVQKASFYGLLEEDLAIWEVDEATLAEAIANVSPKVILLGNLMRDQLDRYGEVDSIRNKWKNSLKKLNKSTTLILNADDPGISILSSYHKGPLIFFGVDDNKINLPKIANIADIKHCLKCGSILNYLSQLSAHMGHYSCPNCKLARPQPKVFAKDLIFDTDFSTHAKISINNSPLTIHYHLPGLYNVYNVLAASSVALSLNFNSTVIVEKIKSFTSAFGRFQKIKIKDRNALIFLIKNPAGANEVLRTIALKSKLNILAILNDKIADGKDVSWIWDTNWEILQKKVKTLNVSGIRAWDLATRLKYAGFKLSKNDINMGNHIPHKYRNKDVNYSIKSSLNKLSNKDTLIILPTYTALLEVQNSLYKLARGIKWQEQ